MTSREDSSYPVRRVASTRKRSSEQAYKTPRKVRNCASTPKCKKAKNDVIPKCTKNSTENSAAKKSEDEDIDQWIDNSFFSAATKKYTSPIKSRIQTRRSSRDSIQGSSTAQNCGKSEPTSTQHRTSKSICDEATTVIHSAVQSVRNVPSELDDSADGLFADLEVPDVTELAQSHGSGNDSIFSGLVSATPEAHGQVESSQSLVPDTPDPYSTQHDSFTENDPIFTQLDSSVWTQAVSKTGTQVNTQNGTLHGTQALSSTCCEVFVSQHVEKSQHTQNFPNLTSEYKSHDSIFEDPDFFSKTPDKSSQRDTQAKCSIAVDNVRLNSCERNTKFAGSVPSNVNITSHTEMSTPKGISSNTTPAKSFRERLKSKLLQNTKVPTPQSSRTMERRRQEMMEQALQEAEELKQRMLTQPEPGRESGDFYGLSDKIRQLFIKHRGISKLYAWQNECLGLPALKSHSNLIYSLPTSGGKTLVAEILMLQELLLRNHDAIFILPFVSIVQEKVRGLSAFAVDLNFLVEEYAASKGSFPPKKRQKRCIYICTIEKANSLVNSLIENKRLDSIGLVIVDELHMLGEGGSRGATLEMSLTKIMHASSLTQIVGMSATLNNIGDLQKFLHAEIYSDDFRPVKLREFVKLEDMMYEIDHSALCPDDRLKHHSIITHKATPSQRQFDPDGIGGLVLETVPKHSCLVFCPTKKNCENIAELVCRAMPSELLNEKKQERLALVAALKYDGNGNICPVLRRTLPYGVAYHHSGLTMDERKLIEEAYSESTLCMLACTSTLAAGVNLPAKRVILRSPYVAANFLSSSQYKQMIGRAGRAGIDTSGESILVLQKRDRNKLMDLVAGPYDYCRSSLFYENKKGIRALLLTTIALQITNSAKSVCEFLRKTMCHIQQGYLDQDLMSIAKEGLQHLLDLKLIVQKRSRSLSGNTDHITSEDSCVIEVTNLGKAVVKGSIDLDLGPRLYQDLYQSQTSLEPLVKALANNNSTADGSIDLDTGPQLYTDLKDAQKSLVVANYLHLIYLVTPYDMADMVRPNWMVYLDELGRFDPSEMKVCEMTGVTESFIARKVSGQRISKPVDERVVKRFYLTLMLYNLWKQRSIWDVASQFNQPRGFVQQLLNSTAAFASCVTHFCKELEEFWAYQDLMTNFVKRLSFCVTMELIPLMEIPGVKLGRARQLYGAGYKTLQLVAYAKADQLVEKLEHLPRRTATEIISSAQMLLQERAEALVEEASDLIRMPSDGRTDVANTNPSGVQ